MIAAGSDISRKLNERWELADETVGCVQGKFFATLIERR